MNRLDLLFLIYILAAEFSVLQRFLIPANGSVERSWPNSISSVMGVSSWPTLSRPCPWSTWPASSRQYNEVYQPAEPLSVVRVRDARGFDLPTGHNVTVGQVLRDFQELTALSAEEEKSSMVPPSSNTSSDELMQPCDDLPVSSPPPGNIRPPPSADLGPYHWDTIRSPSPPRSPVLRVGMCRPALGSVQSGYFLRSGRSVQPNKQPLSTPGDSDAVMRVPHLRPRRVPTRGVRSKSVRTASTKITKPSAKRQRVVGRCQPPLDMCQPSIPSDSGPGNSAATRIKMEHGLAPLSSVMKRPSPVSSPIPLQNTNSMPPATSPLLFLMPLAQSFSATNTPDVSRQSSQDAAIRSLQLQSRARPLNHSLSFVPEPKFMQLPATSGRTMQSQRSGSSQIGMVPLPP
eukprot:15847_1